MGSGKGQNKRVQDKAYEDKFMREFNEREDIARKEREKLDKQNKKYNLAIKKWLLAHDYVLERLRNSKTNKGLTDNDFFDLIGDKIDLVATPEWEYSEHTFGGGGEPALKYKFRGKEYTYELGEMQTGDFIREVAELMNK